MEKTLLISDSQRLAASLGQFSEPEIEPAFIVISGLPGTGKSGANIIPLIGLGTLHRF